jgi:hypothetical protein
MGWIAIFFFLQFSAIDPERMDSRPSTGSGRTGRYLISTTPTMLAASNKNVRVLQALKYPSTCPIPHNASLRLKLFKIMPIAYPRVGSF